MSLVSFGRTDKFLSKTQAWLERNEAAMTPPQNLVLASERIDIAIALELITRDIVTQNWEALGVIGRAQIADEFANSTSNHIYQEIGCQPVGNFDEYRFE